MFKTASADMSAGVSAVAWHFDSDLAVVRVELLMVLHLLLENACLWVDIIKPLILLSSCCL